MKPTATLAFLLESFFTQRLMNQRQASPHTISSYRDTFRLLFQAVSNDNTSEFRAVLIRPTNRNSRLP